MYLFHADKIHFWRFMEIYFCGKPIKLFLGDGMYRKIWKNCYSLVFWCSTRDHEFHSIHAHKSRGIRFGVEWVWLRKNNNMETLNWFWSFWHNCGLVDQWSTSSLELYWLTNTVLKERRPWKEKRKEMAALTINHQSDMISSRPLKSLRQDAHVGRSTFFLLFKLVWIISISFLSVSLKLHWHYITLTDYEDARIW